MPDRWYTLIFTFYVVSGIGLALLLILQPQRRNGLLILIAFVVVQTVFLFIGGDWYLGFVRNGEQLGLQGRYFFPILAPLLFLLLSGWDHLWRERPIGLRLALSGMVLLQLAALGTILTRYYGVRIG